MSSSADLTPLLVERLIKHDESAFEHLYDQYSAALYGIIFRTLDHRETAEEALTDTFLKIWNQIESYDSTKGTLFTWMYRIARNQAIDARRSHQFKAGEKSDEIDHYVHTLTQDDKKENYIGLDVVLSGLEKACQRLLQLNFFMGYSHAEISKKEKMALGSVKTKIRSCLKNVRMELKGDFD